MAKFLMIIKWSNLSSKMEPVAHLKHLSENYTKIIQTTYSVYTLIVLR